MLALLATLCLADAPQTCAERLLPGPCDAGRAAAWAEARPELVLGGTRCAPLAEAVAPLPVSEIAPGNFVHKGRHVLPDPANLADQANIGFIVGEEAVAVIDAGGSRAIGEALYAAIRAETGLPIRWLILTHMHPDHVFGASVFAEAGASLIGHANLAAGLANRAESYLDSLARQAGGALAIGSEIALPDASVGDERDVDLGGRVLRLEAHPTAHTDNDLTVLDEATGTWWMGDLVFHEHLPTIDGSLRGWLALLDALEARPASRIVPGHGGPVLPWPDGAAPMRRYLEALLVETREALARGDSLGTAVPLIGADLRGEWELFDTFHPRNATAAYRELEWE
ncbi:quinoprotein relay system zinc metallohydrolase 2 [soil metagenome]